MIRARFRMLKESKKTTKVRSEEMIKAVNPKEKCISFPLTPEKLMRRGKCRKGRDRVVIEFFVGLAQVAAALPMAWRSLQAELWQT